MKLLAGILTLLGLLVLPGIANATVAPPVVDGTTVRVEADGAADTILVTTAGGFYAVNGTPTTLAVSVDSRIEVDAGAGNDIVDLSALALGTYGSSLLFGHDGTDTLTGGAQGDTVVGEAGDDRLIGFRGPDDLFGGDGDDVMVWNNGDGSDFDIGDAGVDEVEVNGSPTAGDGFVIERQELETKPVTLDRTNLIPFSIDLAAERLTVNGLGGDENITAALPSSAGLNGTVALNLNGGTGSDLIEGGDGRDSINGGAGFDDLFGAGAGDRISGGDGDDHLTGRDGDDTLTGDRGADTNLAGDGDDTIIWNNGDGSDSATGSTGFDQLQVNGSPTDGDSFQLEPNGEDATFKRSNLTAFTIDLNRATDVLLPSENDSNGGIEAVSVESGGGDDDFVVSPGLPGMLVGSNGGSGNDILTGSEEADQFVGGSGNDVIRPGTGNDSVEAGEGDDNLFTRDVRTDVLDGGPGNDQAQTDSTVVDSIEGVESLDSTPIPVTPIPDVPKPDSRALLPSVSKLKVVRSGKRHVLKARVGCPASEAGGCRSAVAIQTARAVRLGKVKAPIVLGSGKVRLDGGKARTLTIRLASGVDDLAGRHRLKVRLRLTSSDSSGNFASRSTSVSLRFPR